MIVRCENFGTYIDSLVESFEMLERRPEDKCRELETSFAEKYILIIKGPFQHSIWIGKEKAPRRKGNLLSGNRMDTY